MMKDYKKYPIDMTEEEVINHVKEILARYKMTAMIFKKINNFKSRSEKLKQWGY
jgi:hypothetical protein